MRTSILLMIVVTVLISPGLVYALDCPAPPKQISRNFSNDVSIGVKALKMFLGEAGFENKTDVAVQNLYAKYPNADRLVLATLLLSQFCSMLNESSDLSSERKFELFERIQDRILTIVIGTENYVTEKPDILLGKMYWSHKSSYGVDTIEENGKEGHHSISFTRYTHDQPNEHDYSIEFDLTSHWNDQVRIVGIDIEVVNWKPITQKLLRLVPYAGLGETKKYFGTFRKQKGNYPTTFAREGHFVKLSKNEIEVFEIQINTPDGGIYDLRLVISYSVSGKTKTLVTEPRRDLWFVNSARVP